MRKVRSSCRSVLSQRSACRRSRTFAQTAPIRARVYVEGLTTARRARPGPVGAASPVRRPAGRPHPGDPRRRAAAVRLPRPLDRGAEQRRARPARAWRCPPTTARSGYAFVNFTDRSGNTVIARFTRSTANRFVADPGIAPRPAVERRPAVHRPAVRQPQRRHAVASAPTATSTSAWATAAAATTRSTTRRRPARCSARCCASTCTCPADDPKGYRIPPDNPFLDGAPVAALPEIWSFGLRNPWKFSFDDPRLGGTGAMVIGDVGPGRARRSTTSPPGGRTQLRLAPARGRHRGRGGRRIRPRPTCPSPNPSTTTRGPTGSRSPAATSTAARRSGRRTSGRYFFADFVAGRVYSIALTVDPATGEATAGDSRRAHRANSAARPHSAT